MIWYDDIRSNFCYTYFSSVSYLKLQKWKINLTFTKKSSIHGYIHHLCNFSPKNCFDGIFYHSVCRKSRGLRKYLQFREKITCLSKYLIKSLYFTKISTLFSLFHTFQIKLFLFFFLQIYKTEKLSARDVLNQWRRLSAFFHYPTW